MRRNFTVREAVRKLRVKGYDIGAMKQDGFHVDTDDLRDGISVFRQAERFSEAVMCFRNDW